MDAIYNWSNHLVPNTKGQIERIAQKLNQRLGEGFNVTEAIDLLLGEGEDLDTIQKVANLLEQDEEEETLTVSSSRKIPVRYADIQDGVANLIKKLKPEEFTEIFASKSSLMSLSEKKQDEFKELVWYAKRHPEDTGLQEELHNYLQPYVDQAIQDSQILAKEAQDSGAYKFKKVASSNYRVKDAGNVYQVDITAKTCTCPRYILCGFNMLGLPCEHILAASKQFDEKFDDELIGNKTIYAQRYGNNVRYAWCNRANNEICIEQSCIASSCPFLKEDKGDTVICTFC